jgi:hypothetical protein
MESRTSRSWAAQSSRKPRREAIFSRSKSYSDRLGHGLWPDDLSTCVTISTVAICLLTGFIPALSLAARFFRHIDHDGIFIQIKRRGDVQRMLTGQASFPRRPWYFASSFAFRSRANILGDDRNPPCHPEGVGCLRPRSSRIDLPSSSNDSR